MASANVARRQKSSRKPSKKSAVQFVQCNLAGTKSGLVAGVASSINQTPSDNAPSEYSDTIGIGLGARSHNSAWGNALAEISDGGFCACSFGIGARAVAHNDGGIAIAIGDDVEAVALGSNGVAIVISYGETHGIVSAGLGGRLVIVLPMLSRSIAFEREVDGKEFRAGRRYTVDSYGLWEEVEEGAGPMSDIVGFENPESQVVSAA